MGFVPRSQSTKRCGARPEVLSQSSSSIPYFSLKCFSSIAFMLSYLYPPERLRFRS
ncbi:unknown protein [Microcystis aeruginosa NIES-843]|uniref:Uncharacterized protein n=1 Tax=Microcystis aeruginosa (strain NIES-843 / IAM M-2473) TaxID=449447 RepID=B0JXH7_MICAN|nr:unknown protein [Microcystis aeruginosa NIES-843]